MIDHIAKMEHMLTRTHDFSNEDRLVVAALYKFTSLPDYKELQSVVQKLCDDAGALGTILLAKEGINGTICAPKAGMTAILDWLAGEPRFDALSLKFSATSKQTFQRMKVRLKNEIVTMGVPYINPSKKTGTYVDSNQWNSLISDSNVMVIDIRNTYETAIGMFEGAVDPKTTNFRDFPSWAEALAKQDDGKRPEKLAMYCTGGIRCEKASALMKNLGFKEVFHLKGGILKYLEDTPSHASKWHGECFVFDGRVALDQNLQPGSYGMCHACRMPLSQTEMRHPDFVDGISCHHCKSIQNPAQTKRFTERQKQIKLAKARGEKHLGVSSQKLK